MVTVLQCHYYSILYPSIFRKNIHVYKSHCPSVCRNVMSLEPCLLHSWIDFDQTWYKYKSIFIRWVALQKVQLCRPIIIIISPDQILRTTTLDLQCWGRGYLFFVLLFCFWYLVIPVIHKYRPNCFCLFQLMHVNYNIMSFCLFQSTLSKPSKTCRQRSPDIWRT